MYPILFHKFKLLWPKKVKGFMRCKLEHVNIAFATAFIQFKSELVIIYKV